jgi:thiol:disulfide interchange protein DsbD
MARRWIAFALALLLLAPAALAQRPAKGTLYTRIEDGVVRAALEIALDPGWHIYNGPTKADLGHPKAIGSPTEVTLSGEGIAWSPVRFPEPEKIDQGMIELGVWIYGHSGKPVLYAAGRLAPGASGADVKAKIKGLVCEEACIPYREELASSGSGPDALFASFPADLAPPEAAASGGVTAPDPADEDRPEEPAPTPVDPRAGDATSGAAGDPAAEASPVAPTGGEAAGAGAASEPPRVADKSLFLFLLAAIGGGLFALVMPCTYPMIPITISFFTKQAEKRGGTPLALSLVYGAGIVVIFVIVGVVFGSLIKPFAANPIVNLLLGLAFVYFGLVLFGALKLEPPRFLMNVAGTASMRGGFLGVFLMGATLVVTSFTCTAPFVGTLLSFGATEGGSARVALGMAVFGLTMAIPFVLLSLIPGRISAMPRSGEWMNTVKVTFGFVEIAAAFKFFSNSDLVWQWNLLSREFFLLLWAGIFVVAGVYLFGLIRLHGASPEISPARLSIGLAFVLFAIYCLSGATGSAMDPVMTAIIPNYSNRPLVGTGATVTTHTIVVDDYEAARRRASEEGKLLLVNFTGHT